MTNALTVNRLADLQTATTKRSFQIPLENNIVKLLYFYTTFEMTAILLRQKPRLRTDFAFDTFRR